MSELKKEFKNYMEDLEKNIQNKKDLEYIKSRTAEFMNAIVNNMENIIKHEEEKISKIVKNQTILEEKVNIIQDELNEIEQELYVEEDDEEEIEGNYDFQIICPYCDYEFLIDLDSENHEVQCPECNNIIELDWTGNSEEQESGNTECGKGHCSKCKGCDDTSNDEDDDM